MKDDETSIKQPDDIIESLVPIDDADDRGLEPNANLSAEEHYDDEEDEDIEHEEIDQPFRADDPLAPAFDLERGEPISGDDDEGQGLPWQSRVSSAKEFLNTELLYRYDVIEPEFRRQVAGVFRLDLRGDSGGSWTVTLGDDIKVENVQGEAEVALSMTHADFVNLVNGDLNPQLAILAKKVRIQGDLKRAMIFQSLLVPMNEP